MVVELSYNARVDQLVESLIDQPSGQCYKTKTSARNPRPLCRLGMVFTANVTQPGT
jgi:hypothetical protein